MEGTGAGLTIVSQDRPCKWSNIWVEMSFGHRPSHDSYLYAGMQEEQIMESGQSWQQNTKNRVGHVGLEE